MLTPFKNLEVNVKDMTAGQLKTAAKLAYIACRTYAKFADIAKSERITIEDREGDPMDFRLELAKCAYCALRTAIEVGSREGRGAGEFTQALIKARGGQNFDVFSVQDLLDIVGKAQDFANGGKGEFNSRHIGPVVDDKQVLNFHAGEQALKMMSDPKSPESLALANEVVPIQRTTGLAKDMAFMRTKKGKDPR